MTRGRTPFIGVALALALPSPLAPRDAARHIFAPWMKIGGRVPLATSPARCSPVQLRASVGQQTGGAGSVFTTVVLRNVGARSCTLRGYPGVSLLDRQRRQIGRTARWDPGVVRLVTLPPGGAASTLVHTLNPGVGTTTCLPPSTTLRLYPPGGYIALFVPAHLSECLGTLGVLPVVPGIDGVAS